ncbi:MAG: HAD-IA family hydrolase [Dehalococcoidia bacterium]
MSLQVIFFDLYGTLAAFDPPREVIQKRAAAAFGMEVTTEGVDAGYLQADAFMSEQNSRAPVRNMQRGEQRDFFARFEQLVLRGAGHDVDLETAAQVWERVREQEYELALFDDVLEGMDRLRAMGYRLGVISNVPHTGRDISDHLGLTDHIDMAITSKDAGVEKPHPPIFLAALEQAGVEAAEAAYVGDQLESDINGSLRVGLRPILMDRYNSHPDYTAHQRVENMPGLVEMLERHGEER